MRTNRRRQALVIEDNKYHGKWICQFLRGLDFDTIWVIRILEIQRNGALCICLDPNSEQAIETQSFIEWGNFVVALVDGLLGLTAASGFHGWHVLPLMGKCDIPRILISADESDNRIMERDYGGEFATHHKLLRPDAFRSDLISFLTQLGLLQ